MKPFAKLAEPKINNLLLIGAGLIGGSLTLALKQAGVMRHVVAVGRSATVIDEALKLGIADTAVSIDSAEFKTAIAQADVIVLAMPVGQTKAVCEKIVPHLQADTIITDATAVQAIIDDLQAATTRPASPAAMPSGNAP